MEAERKASKTIMEGSATCRRREPDASLIDSNASESEWCEGTEATAGATAACAY